MNYSRTLDFASIHDQPLLASYLDSAVSTNDVDAVNKILINLKYPNTSYLHRVTDKRIIQKIIDKWQSYSFPNGCIDSVLQSPCSTIVRMCLDYLIDPDTKMSSSTFGSHWWLQNVGCYIYPTAENKLSHNNSNMYSFLHSPKSFDEARDAKHDEIMKVYLEYYPLLKKKYHDKLPQTDYDAQLKYIIDRIQQRPTERIATLKLIIDTFGHNDHSYIADLFMQSCSTNKVPVVKCMLELNNNFCAHIENNVVANYKIQDTDIMYVKNKLNQTITGYNSWVTKLQTKMSNNECSTKIMFETIGSHLDAASKQNHERFKDMNARMNDAIENITTNKQCCDITTKKIQHGESLDVAHVKNHCAKIIKKIRDDHAEIIRCIVSDHAETIRCIASDHATEITKLKRDINGKMLFICFVISIIVGIMVPLCISVYQN